MKSACATTLSLVTLALWAGSLCYSQSLGDVAREQREKQARKDQAAAKPARVITDEDMPSRSDAPAGEATRATQSDSPSPSPSSKSAEQWKARIAAQKKAVENLQGQITRLSASIHYVEANRYYSGVQHNQRQDQKQEQVERLQAQLADQQQKLEDMQEAARKQGFGNAVYDP
jgi:predicted RNase H-like nuclease (RuvC/YqgF family)